MELNIEMKQQLEELLANPEMVEQAHIPFLQNLVNTYPYYKPLYLLLAKAGIGTANEQEFLANAALYNNGSVLFNTIHKAKTLKINKSVNIIKLSESEKIAVDKVEDVVAETVITHTEAPVVVDVDNTIAEDSKTIVAEADEQETFEEINELVVPEASTPALADVVEEKAATIPQPIAQPAAENIANDDLFIEAINSDFFAFEKNFTAEIIEEPTAEVEEKTEDKTEDKPVESTPNAENVVSKYDDEKLPFSFLWWLAKTRKNHQQIFQPYANTNKPALPKSAALQQQFVEHIFHLQAPLAPISDLPEVTENPKANTKENELIEKFIKNEPQLKAPKPDQINNENKAKRSSEDNYDLVSETLAVIYIEQMLYHKAIDTYQKLSLKYPEKSGYFADLILSLEKKI